VILATPLAITPYAPLTDRIICQPDDTGGDGWVVALIPPAGPALRLYAGTQEACACAMRDIARAADASAAAQGHATFHLSDQE